MTRSLAAKKGIALLFLLGGVRRCTSEYIGTRKEPKDAIYGYVWNDLEPKDASKSDRGTAKEDEDFQGPFAPTRLPDQREKSSHSVFGDFAVPIRSKKIFDNATREKTMRGCTKSDCFYEDGREVCLCWYSCPYWASLSCDCNSCWVEIDGNRCSTCIMCGSCSSTTYQGVDCTNLYPKVCVDCSGSSCGCGGSDELFSFGPCIASNQTSSTCVGTWRDLKAALGGYIYEPKHITICDGATLVPPRRGGSSIWDLSGSRFSNPFSITCRDCAIAWTRLSSYAENATFDGITFLQSSLYLGGYHNSTHHVKGCTFFQKNRYDPPMLEVSYTGSGTPDRYPSIIIEDCTFKHAKYDDNEGVVLLEYEGANAIDHPEVQNSFEIKNCLFLNNTHKDEYSWDMPAPVVYKDDPHRLHALETLVVEDSCFVGNAGKKSGAVFMEWCDGVSWRTCDEIEGWTTTLEQSGNVGEQNTPCDGFYYVDANGNEGCHEMFGPTQTNECHYEPEDCGPENPCVHGSCTENVDEITCWCDEGWTGINCDFNIDDCDPSPCVHGACIDEVNGYTCSCEYPWIGTDCEDCCTGCISTWDIFVAALESEDVQSVLVCNGVTIKPPGEDHESANIVGTSISCNSCIIERVKLSTKNRSFTLRGITFVNSSMEIESNVDALVEDCIFTGNSTVFAHARCSSWCYASPNVQIKNCTFKDNYYEEYVVLFEGQGMHTSWNKYSVISSHFENNRGRSELTSLSPIILRQNRKGPREKLLIQDSCFVGNAGIKSGVVYVDFECNTNYCSYELTLSGNSGQGNVHCNGIYYRSRYETTTQGCHDSLEASSQCSFVEPTECIPNPCQHGSCFGGSQGGNLCWCDVGWHGPNCDRSCINSWDELKSAFGVYYLYYEAHGIRICDGAFIEPPNGHIVPILDYGQSINTLNITCNNCQIARLRLDFYWGFGDPNVTSSIQGVSFRESKLIYNLHQGWHDIDSITDQVSFFVTTFSESSVDITGHRNATVLFKDCTFQDSSHLRVHTLEYQHVNCCYDAPRVTIEGCTFRNNEYGGSGQKSAVVLFEGGGVIENSWGDWDGGPYTIADSFFFNNKYKNHPYRSIFAPVAYIQDNDGRVGTLTVTNSCFVGNSGRKSGAVYIEGYLNCTAVDQQPKAFCLIESGNSGEQNNLCNGFFYANEDSSEACYITFQANDQCSLHPCSPNPCSHGLCSEENGVYTCLCEDGWTGTNCDEAVTTTTSSTTATTTNSTTPATSTTTTTTTTAEAITPTTTATTTTVLNTTTTPTTTTSATTTAITTTTAPTTTSPSDTTTTTTTTTSSSEQYLPSCDPPCGSHGTCSEGNICVCDEGWSGATCAEESCGVHLTVPVFCMSIVAVVTSVFTASW